MDPTGVVLAGRYRVLRSVARGGMGAVWEAEHVTLHHKVAVKFLLETGDPESDASKRFLREARVAASVKHRNVLEIIDFGFAQGAPYMVMELLRGQTLGDLLAAQRRLAPARAVEIVAGVLRGLAAVHDAGLVHRDIKPHNVFLVEDEDGDFPKLVDFGLSRLAGRTDLTAEGVMLGTPLYMAPEQVRRAPDLDARVDVYAMGVMLHEMLSGSAPFQAPKIAEVLDAILHRTPPSLVDAGVPAGLAQVVEKAMARDRDARFADARAMRTALVQAIAISGATPSGSVPLVRESAPGSESRPRPSPRPAPSPSAPAEPRSSPRDEVPEELPDEVPERAAPAPPRESGFVVLVRTLVLATVTALVALLLIEVPWSSSVVGPTDPDAGLADAAAPEVAPVLAAPVPTVVPTLDDASVRDAAPDPDAGPSSDAGADAADALDAADAADAADIDAADALDAGDDAGEAADALDAAIDAVPEAPDAAELDDAGTLDAAPAASTVRPARARRPPRRVTPHRPARHRARPRRPGRHRR